MKRQDKEILVEELRAELAQAPSVVVASSLGMSANTVNQMRMDLRKHGVTFRVLKNTLSKRAMEGTDMEVLFPYLKGFTALAYHTEDAVATAKALAKANETHKQLELRAGYLNGTLLDSAGVEALSKMPGKDELRASLLGTLNGVGGSFVRVLAAGPQSMLTLLSARKDSLAA